MTISISKFGNSILAFLLFILAFPSYGQHDYYFAQGERFDAEIPSPEDYLGYPIGDRHTRYDLAIAYLKELARLSERVTFQTIGQTNELRPLAVVTITSPQNHASLEEIRQQHLQLTDPGQPLPELEEQPIFIHLAYNVHGNEASGLETSLLTAYYYAACEDENVLYYLDESVIFIDPAQNPDGRDRFANWVNMHRGNPPVADPQDREHNEVWPGGRGNHYWFDLNRDWLPAAHVESRARLDFYHQWLPNVVIDFHEMGTNSTYYFEPSPPLGSENPLVPRRQYEELNVLLAQYQAQALDSLGSLYFTKEIFDNFYPGYGSTYPDFQGGVGATFEQASSRGNRQESSTGILTFPFTVRNHLVTGLATVRGAVENKQTLLEYQREFYSSALSEARKNPVNAYVYGEQDDINRLNRFTELLLRHKIKVYALEEELSLNGEQFLPGKAYIVPTEQVQYRLVESVFERRTEFVDSVFYDASAWTLALSYGIPHAEFRTGKLPLGNQLESVPEINLPEPQKSDYAYLMDWTDYAAPAALQYLLQHDVLAQVAMKPFSAQMNDGNRQFHRGTISVPLQAQQISKDSVYTLIRTASEQFEIPFYATATGFSADGVDLGSNNLQTVKMPKVLILTGEGVQSTEVGEVWFLLDQVGLPITKVEISNLPSIALHEYSTIVMVNGNYNKIAKTQSEKLANWINDGGTLVTFKGAAEWAITQELADAELLKDTADVPKQRFNYEDAREREGAKAIRGSIYQVDLDITNPLGFGYTRRDLAVYKNSNTLFALSKTSYHTVAQYSPQPLLSGYISNENLSKLSGTASLLLSTKGKGRVVLFADNPNFRGMWLGTNKLFLNAIYFGNLIN
ncbi:hypothetical protein OKW21_003185 [Catalinimonas alkaloidigena]|uniref:M14 family metallopeptidase n=1 Tax=Catalinimonas alkaloidigena TaxID=1075417 RepID=UPI002405458F|nr:M14 family metallopeptidase [Catalinimonas alkaloidigena]MDF9797922.1 hypothetical protein [Catalinimonas alkaloidigena]